MEENKEINETTVEKNYDYFISIRLGNNTKSYYFSTDLVDLEKDEPVVVETIRGLELGYVDSKVHPMSEYKQELELKPVLRKATLEDQKNHEENIELAKDAFNICTEEVKKLDLDMRLVTSEYTLDRTKVIFSYFSEDRVDFRELLKALAARLHCRIELRQIGKRDRSKLVGGIGVCGLPLCCATFLNEFDAISINRAKNQLLTLNMPKLSGQCDRLMCCLKYEDEAYTELRKEFPKIGTAVTYNDAVYHITSMNVLTRSIKLENKDDVQFLDLEVVKELLKGQKNEK